MVDRLSKSADLSKRYTNHCVQATTVTLLKQQGVEDRKVCLLTGHKAERTLVSYNVPDEGEHRKMASYLDEKAPSAKTGPSESTTGGGFNIVTPGAMFNNLTVNIVRDAIRKDAASTFPDSSQRKGNSLMAWRKKCVTLYLLMAKSKLSNQDFR